MAFVPQENIVSAIHKYKARVAHIERLLNGPLPTVWKGQPVKVSQSSLLRLEEEKQHLLLRIEELERELVRLEAPSAGSKSLGGSSATAPPEAQTLFADVWKDFHVAFSELANEEANIVRTRRKDVFPLGRIPVPCAVFLFRRDPNVELGFLQGLLVESFALCRRVALGCCDSPSLCCHIIPQQFPGATSFTGVGIGGVPASFSMSKRRCRTPVPISCRGSWACGACEARIDDLLFGEE